MKAWHIKQWNPLYERADTRKSDYMGWYAKQTKLIGEGIGCTLSQPDKLELLGLWNLLEVLATQNDKWNRGWLVRNRKPLTVEKMAALIPGGIPPAKFTRALEHFSQPEVDWLELVEWHPQDSPDLSRIPAACGHTPGESPALLPADREKAPTGGAAPGQPPAVLPAHGRNSATDRQTDSKQTDRQTEGDKKKGTLTPALRAGPSLADVAAGKVQYAALSARQTELLAGKADWTLEERAEYKKNAALLAELQKKQRAGDFSVVSTRVEGAPA